MLCFRVRKELTVKSGQLPPSTISKVFSSFSESSFTDFNLFPYKNNSGIHWSDFEQILEATELKMHHKLKPSHITLPGGLKTSVRAAAVTLSATTAAAIEFMNPEKKHIAEIVKIINDVSTVFETPCI